MRKFLVALVLALMPFQAFAQTQQVAATAADADSNGSTFKTVAITAGVITGVVVADVLTGGTLTTPILRTIGLAARPAAAAAAPAGAPAFSPAVMEARAAGAVLGEMITPATAVRDAAARADMLYVGALALGGAAGGWLLSKVVQ